LHQVAEHVLAKARYVDDGEIRLTAHAGGFATPLLTGGRRVRVDADELVLDGPDGSQRTDMTTVAELAAFAGIEPGFPTELYAPATLLRPNDVLHVDRRAAEVLAAWVAMTAEVLSAFAEEIAEADPSPLILWPEHFDQAFFTRDADTSRHANYGASPGDDGHPEPYLYVGPFEPVAPHDFWNATHFNGAVLSLTDLIAADEPAAGALAFLRAGRALLATR